MSPASPSRDEVLAALSKIKQSNTLGRSDRLCHFLDFVVHQTLDGHAEDLKEYAIGVEVFAKGADFDPRMDSAVRVDARRLRAKLDEYYVAEGSLDPIVITMPKGAYVPVFQTRAEYEATLSAPARALAATATGGVTDSNAGVGLDSSPALPQISTPKPSRRAWLWGAGATALAAATGGVAFWRSSRETPSGPHLVRTLAVLPFANLTGRSELDLFCDGLAEELIDRLARTQGIRVLARRASFAYKGKAMDAKSMARSLEADSLLEGSVRQGKDRLRVTVQLVRGSDGYQVWSESLDLPYDDELGTQARIGQAVERRLAENLPKSAQAKNAAAEEEQQLANLVAQASFLSQRRTDDSLRRALELSNRAISIRPDYAPAYAILAETSFALAALRPVTETQKWLAECRKNAEKAMSLGSNLAGPLAALGSVKMDFEWDWSDAEALFKKALERNPNHPIAHARYARLLTLSGRHAEALQHAKAAEMAAPLEVHALATVGQVHYYAQQFDIALQTMQRAVEIDPGYVNGHYTLARIHGLGHRFSEARQELDRVPPEERKGEHSAILAWVLALEGRRSEAADAASRAGTASCISRAALELAMGDRAMALSILEQAAERKDADFFYARVSPVLRDLKGDARLEAIWKKAGLE
jgi:TolB-like protein/Tfp pilus assembly protein PilF